MHSFLGPRNCCFWSWQAMCCNFFISVYNVESILNSTSDNITCDCLRGHHLRIGRLHLIMYYCIAVISRCSKNAEQSNPGMFPKEIIIQAAQIQLFVFHHLFQCIVAQNEEIYLPKRSL